MNEQPWWRDEDNPLGTPLQYPVKKPPQFDREHKLLPPDLTERVLPQQDLLQAYTRGILAEATARLERATEASITDPEGRGVLEFWRVDGLTVQHATWLHPDVPYGHRWRVDGGMLRSPMTLEAFVNDYPGLSDGRATLIR